MDTNPDGGGARRRILRRSRGIGGGGGFSPSISTRSESLRTSADADEVDDAIDPEQMGRDIRSGTLVTPIPPRREDPSGRLNEVALAGSASYAKEYRLQLLHRMLMRNVPLDQIAKTLRVSISTVQKDRVALKERLREAAKEMNINEMVGGQQAFYDEVSGMAMRIASAGETKDENGNRVAAVPTPMKLAAMRTALAANADRTRFLNTTGVFDVLRFRRSEDGSALSDVQQLMMKTQEMMESLMAAPEEEVKSISKKSGGFDSMTFDDIDASESHSEIQEL